jgi:peptidylprolyl isomerase
MNRFVPILVLAACTSAAFAQTPAAKPPAPKAASPAAAAKPSTAKPSTANSAAAAAPTPTPWIKLPPGVPRVAHLPVKMPFALRYEDITVGKGAEGEAGKVWHIKYTGWRAADGVKFDSWDDHRQPVTGSDGKPELGPDGKPKMADPVPMAIPIGVGRVIPGFDYGLDGMKIGGKRRIFIPWQMAYGTHAMPDRPDHPGIPAKCDLIFDVELVDVTEMQMPHPPAVPGNHPMPPHPGAGEQPNAAPTAPTPKPALPVTPSAPATQPAAPAATTPPAQPAAPAQTAPPPPPSNVQAQPK